jgi:hypothetical protein
MNGSRIKPVIIFAGAGLLWLWGCQAPRSFETSVSLLPPTMEDAALNTAAPEPTDPLEVPAAVETIAAKAGLKPYTTGEEETTLLDMADADLLGGAATPSLNITEYKHPELPVYLTVTRKPEEILILLNYTPDANGKINPEVEKLFKSIRKQLIEITEDQI